MDHDAANAAVEMTAGVPEEPAAQSPASDQQAYASDEGAHDGADRGDRATSEVTRQAEASPETQTTASGTSEVIKADVVPAGAVSAASKGTTDTHAALRAENERLRAEVDSYKRQAPPHIPRHTVRRTLAAILVVLTCLTLLLSTVTVWAEQTFLSNDARWTAIVGPIGQDPKVVDAVSVYVANQVVTVLQVQQRAENALPPKAQFLAVPITDVVRQYSQKAVANAMRTPQFQQAWVAVNSAVHTQVVAALRGESKTITIVNGVVTLNLLPVITQGLQTVRENVAGLLPAQVKLPPPRSTEQVQQGIQRLSQALGIQLPPNFGQVTLFRSDQFTTTQQIVRLLDMFSIILPLVTLMFLIAALWLSVNRRRTVLELGIGIAITFAVAKIAIAVLQQQAVASVANPTGREIIQPVVGRALSYLETSTTWLLVLGVVTALAAFLVGRPEWFQAGYAKTREAYTAASEWTHQQWQQLRHRERPTQEQPPTQMPAGTA